MKNITSYPSSLVVSCHTSAVTSVPFSPPSPSPSHTVSSPLSLSFLSHVSIHPPCALSLPPISSLSCFYVTIYVSWTSAVCSNQLFIFQHYNAIRCLVRRTISHSRLCIAGNITINWRCEKSARRCISNSAIYIELCRVKNIGYKS